MPRVDAGPVTTCGNRSDGKCCQGQFLRLDCQKLGARATRGGGVSPDEPEPGIGDSAPGVEKPFRRNLSESMFVQEVSELTWAD
jgi:hypothetical protein